METTNETRIGKDGTMMTCYLQTNRGDQCQETYETASRDASRRARQLRSAGYGVIVSPMGPQVTPMGRIKLTLVTIAPGRHVGTFGLPTVGWEAKPAR